MGSDDFVTADKSEKNGWPFFWPFVLEFGSFWHFSGQNLAPWQKVDLATLLLSVACLVFPFSLLWPTLLTCSGRASVTAAVLMQLSQVTLWSLH